MKRKDSILQNYYYSKLPKYQKKGEVKKQPIKHYVFAEDWNRGSEDPENVLSNKSRPFVTEAENLKTYITKNYPGEEVIVMPGYGQEYFEKQVKPTLGKVGKQDRVYIFGHHGGKYAGTSIGQWGDELENAQKRAGDFNCYLGSCGTEDIASAKYNPKIDEKYHLEPAFSRIKNLYYRPNTQWLGVNPNAAAYPSSKDGVVEAMFSRTNFDPNKDKYWEDVYQYRDRYMKELRKSDPEYLKNEKIYDNIANQIREYSNREEEVPDSLWEARGRVAPLIYSANEKIDKKLRKDSNFLKLEKKALDSEKARVVKNLTYGIDYSKGTFNPYINIDQRAEYKKNRPPSLQDFLLFKRGNNGLIRYQDAGEISDPSSKYKQRLETSISTARDFWKDWYSKRKTLPQFADVSERRLKVLDQPYEIEYTDPNEMLYGNTTGEYLPETRKFKFVNPSVAYNPNYSVKGNQKLSESEFNEYMAAATGIPVVGHEWFHKFQFEAPEGKINTLTKYPFKSKDEEFVSLKESGLSPGDYRYMSQKSVVPSDNYLRKMKSQRSPFPASNDKPTIFNHEMEAGVGMLRMAEKLDPTKTYTPEDVKSIIEKYSQYDADRLKENLSPEETEAQHSGWFINNMFRMLGRDPKRIAQYLNSVARTNSLPNAQTVQAKYGGPGPKKRLPLDYKKFLEYNKTAPENRQATEDWVYGNPDDYDHYGMWDALGKPKDFQQALEMNPDWEPDPYDKSYHGASTNPNTGVFLKSYYPGQQRKPGSTTWMEVAEFYKSSDPNWNANKLSIIYDPELKRLRYVPKKEIGGGLDKYQSKGQVSYPWQDGLGQTNYSSDRSRYVAPIETRIKANQQIAEREKEKERQRIINSQTSIGPARKSTAEDDKKRYELNKQDALRTGRKFNYVTGETADKNDPTAKGRGWGYVSTPALAQTAAMATPSGRNYEAGNIGANMFVNMNPITAPATSAGRIAQMTLGQNPYGFNKDGVASNILPALGLVGDVAGAGSIRMLPGGKELFQAPGAALKNVASHPLIASVPSVVKHKLYRDYANAAIFGGLDKAGSIATSVPGLRDLYKGAAYKAGQLSGGTPFTNLKNLTNKILKGDKTNYTGGNSNRNLLKNYIYGDASGFTESNLPVTGFDQYFERYGDMKRYGLDASSIGDNPVSMDFLHQGLKNKGFATKLFDEKGQPIRNLTNEEMYGNLKKFLQENDQLVYTADGNIIGIDDIAGHTRVLRYDKPTDNIMLKTQDIWKFAPDKYAKRWFANDKKLNLDLSTKEGTKKVLENYLATKQAGLMEKAGKPFILLDERPVAATPAFSKDRFTLELSPEELKAASDEVTEFTGGAIPEGYPVYGSDIPYKETFDKGDAAYIKQHARRMKREYGGLIKYQDKGEVTYTHQPSAFVDHDNDESTPMIPGEKYMLKRTVTPYTRKRDIKRYTQQPTDPRQVNFLSNYAGAIGSDPANVDFQYPTSVPFEGGKHWNIDRFLIEPQFDNRFRGYTGDYNSPRVNVNTDLDQMKANTLADMYKYYMLQNDGRKGKSFRQAKRFVRKEVNPRIQGAYLNNYIYNPSNKETNRFADLTTFANTNKLKLADEAAMMDAVHGKRDPVWHQDQFSKDELKDISMDYFRNYRKMSKRDAKKLWNEWEKGTEEHRQKEYEYALSQDPQIAEKMKRFYSSEQEAPERTGGLRNIFDNLRQNMENRKLDRQIRKGIRNQRDCYGANCYENNNTAEYGGITPIEDQMGQWKYPGIPTRIRGKNITMKGLTNPLVAKTNRGITKLLLPNMEYEFEPMTQFVDEHPVPNIPQVSNRTPMVMRNFGGERPPRNINLSLPKMGQKRGKVGINPYIYYERPQPEVNIMGAGFQGNTRLNNRWDLMGGMNMGRVSVPRENFSQFLKPSYNVGLAYRFGSGGQHGGLDRWFAEKWVDVKTGKACGRQEGENRAYPACRPSKRISSQTPKTSSEMSSAEKAKFKSIKQSSQRIPYNHKRR